MNTNRYTGILSWINFDKCIAVITQKKGKDLINLELSCVSQEEMRRCKKIKDGAKVSFEVEKGHKILSAVNVFC